MSLVFIAQRGAAAAKAETGSEVSEEDVVLERPDSDNVVALNVQVSLGEENLKRARYAHLKRLWMIVRMLGLLRRNVPVFACFARRVTGAY